MSATEKRIVVTKPSEFGRLVKIMRSTRRDWIETVQLPRTDMQGCRWAWARSSCAIGNAGSGAGSDNTRQL